MRVSTAYHIFTSTVHVCVFVYLYVLPRDEYLYEEVC